MKRNQFLLAILTCFSLSFSAVAQQIDTTRKAKIGYALSGGGSKGIAQIGVLKVLEEQGLRPDVIAGTSIGSILGGLYAIGYSIEDLEKLATTLDWEYYFNDELERVHLPIEEYPYSDRYQLRFPINDNKVSLPTGFVKGQKISLLLSRLTIPVHNVTNFDDFKIPYRAVATDFETGNAVVFSKGDLGDAIRASMSIPSVFEPYEIDNKLLIDGGLARNLPVEDAFAAGADKVIGVDIGAPLYRKDQLTSVFEILEQTSSYKIADVNEKQTEMADLVIRPRIEGISALAFDQGDTLLRRGIDATNRRLQEIRKFVETPQNLKQTNISIPEKVKIASIEIKGCNEKQLKTVNNLLQLKAPKTYKLDEIENRIKKLYGSGLVKLAKYRLYPQQDGYQLVITVVTQSGESMRVSFNYDANYKAALLVNLTLRNRIFTGSKMSLDLRLSENPAMFFDYFAYTSGRPNIGWQAKVQTNFYPGFSFRGKNKDDQFRMAHHLIEGSISSALNNRLLISAGIGRERYARSEEFFDPDEDNLRLTQSYLHFNLLRDTYDRLHFPNKGSRVSLDAQYSFDRKLRLLESDTTSAISDQNAMIRLQAYRVLPITSKIRPIVMLEGGYTLNTENNFLHRFYLGRALPREVTHVEFFGLRYMERPVSAYAMAGLKLQLEVLKDIYVNPLFSYAFVQEKTKAVIDNVMSPQEMTFEDHIYGTGIELGWLSIAGPVSFTTEYNFDQKDLNFTFHFGYYF